MFLYFPHYAPKQTGQKQRQKSNFPGRSPFPTLSGFLIPEKLLSVYTFFSCCFLGLEWHSHFSLVNIFFWGLGAWLSNRVTYACLAGIRLWVGFSAPEKAK
jgi:hypothetical protein